MASKLCITSATVAFLAATVSARSPASSAAGGPPSHAPSRSGRASSFGLRGRALPTRVFSLSLGCGPRLSAARRARSRTPPGMMPGSGGAGPFGWRLTLPPRDIVRAESHRAEGRERPANCLGEIRGLFARNRGDRCHFVPFPRSVLEHRTREKCWFYAAFLVGAAGFEPATWSTQR
jgi:hypothetical protein